MRLGGVDEWFGGWHNITPAVARKVNDLGFTGLGLHYHGDPLEQPLAEAQATKQILDDHGIAIAQFWGKYPRIIDPDENIRQEGVRICRNIVQRAAELGAFTASLRPTSMHPASEWAPHPLNYAPETEDRLVRSLSEVAETCEEYQITVTLEVYTTTTLRSPEKIREIIERTGSDWILVNCDMPNLVPDLLSAFNNTALINHIFDVLEPYILTAHLKDFQVEPGHMIHMNEVLPGTGILDWDTFFRRFEALRPDGYMLIEHLSDYAQVQQARDFVVGKLDELGITIRK
jgi:sugar phosphate isomerase/epimerase